MIAAFNYYFSEQTKIDKACLKIPGIGKKMAQQTLDRVGISSDVEIGKLSAFQLSKIKNIIEQNYDTDHELRTKVKERIFRLASISSYRGFRHRQGLPCRGQRTHSNARTSRKHKQR